LATFRHSFAVLALAATDHSKFEVSTNHPMRIVKPGELTSLLHAPAA
jgi:hypothetical protein